MREGANPKHAWSDLPSGDSLQYSVNLAILHNLWYVNGGGP